MRVAADVSPLELAEYQKAARLVLRHPLITASYPDASALPLVRRWAGQLRTDFGEVLGYTLLSSGDTIRLRRTQDTLDGTRPAVTRARPAVRPPPLRLPGTGPVRAGPLGRPDRTQRARRRGRRRRRAH